MSGLPKSIQAEIWTQYSAIYMHCALHCLNLVLVKAYKLKRAKDPSIFETWWVGRQDSIVTFLELFPTVAGLLESFVDNQSDLSQTAKSNSLIAAITEFSFIFPLILAEKVNFIRLSTSASTHKGNLDLHTYCEHIDVYKSVLKELMEADFLYFYGKAVQTVKSVETLRGKVEDSPLQPLRFFTKTMSFPRTLSSYVKNSIRDFLDTKLQYCKSNFCSLVLFLMLY